MLVGLLGGGDWMVGGVGRRANGPCFIDFEGGYESSLQVNRILEEAR